ncbi:MAG: dihydropteroate synthase [Candidatus Omnitrophica bacterium]|nr:dihydropteroate synthase [Candidatus Omnitrophota bacterium]
MELGRRTLIMGIVNVTPDSFSGDGQFHGDHIARAVAFARKLRRQGADILDIGGESTRPGAPRVPLKEELERVIPVIAKLAPSIDVPISVDTYKPRVAHEALQAGASMVNTVQGTPPDKRLLKAVRDHSAGIVLTHIKGTPRSMQKNPYYDDILKEITAALQSSVENCLEIGINSDRIIVDPGIGFGKTVDHNLMILNRLENLKRLDRPLLVGTSRKSFIGHLLNREVHQRLSGTIATVTASIFNGAHIVRVHDVAQVHEAVRMTDAILTESQN